MKQEEFCPKCEEKHRQMRTKRDDDGTMKMVCLKCFIAMGSCIHEA